MRAKTTNRQHELGKARKLTSLDGQGNLKDDFLLSVCPSKLKREFKNVH